MQLIRAINKSNRSNNNNNQTSSGSFNKVVIVAPPAARSSSASHQKNGNSGQTPVPVSPSVALPALKKRTSIVKQSVPPPVPARRGSPRSKSNFHKVSSSDKKDLLLKPTIDVNQLVEFARFEQNGCQKVKEWLETVEIPTLVEDKADVWIPEQVGFRSVRSLIESFSQHERKVKKSICDGQKIADSSRVKIHVDVFNSLESFGHLHRRTNHHSSGGTDSGIDIPARYLNKNRHFAHQFRRDGEFVWYFCSFIIIPESKRDS